MLTRGVRLQLAVFAVLTVFGVSTVLVNYLDLSQLFGYGQYAITAEFADATGLHAGAVVTYRGVEIGKVRSVDLAPDTAVATLGINDDVHVPAHTQAAIRSMSAVGENSVELTPDRPGPPWLPPGGRIPVPRTAPLPRTDRLITSLNDLVASVPPQQLNTVLDELNTGLQGQGPQVTELLDATRTVLHRAGLNLEPTVGLIHELQPFLRTQLDIAGNNRATAQDLAAFTDQLRRSDGDIRAVLAHTPPAVSQLGDLQGRLEPALPHLLSDLVSTGQVIRTQLPGVSQILVLYPAISAVLQRAVAEPGATPASAHLASRMAVNNPPSCYTGYTPMSQERSFGDTSEAAMPPDQYCKTAPSDPRAVRGARNYPCAGQPGKRGPDVATCGGPRAAAAYGPSPDAGEEVGQYDPETGNALLPDGHLYLLGDVQQREEPWTWRQLLVK